MPKLINTRKAATTETFVYDDGTEETVPRVAYVAEDNTVHTEDCPAVVKHLASDDAGEGPNYKEVDLAEAIGPIDNGLPTDLTECRDCDKLRAAADYPSTEDKGTTTDTKEKHMPTKTATKITLPAAFKPTPSVLAVVEVLEKDGYGTTAEIATAAGVTPTSAKSALLALESAGIVVHTTAKDKAKTMTWAPKNPAGATPAKKASAADYAATMAQKTAANTAKKAAAPKAAAPAAAKDKPTGATAVKAATTRVSTGERQAKALAALQKHPNEARSVLQIEQDCGYPVKTLAGVLARMAEKGETGVERADTTAGRKGFKWVPPKAAKKAAAPKA